MVRRGPKASFLFAAAEDPEMIIAALLGRTWINWASTGTEWRRFGLRENLMDL